jgi:hypothetical protein
MMMANTFVQMYRFDATFSIKFTAQLLVTQGTSGRVVVCRGHLVISLPDRLVEGNIALSIAYVAAENLFIRYTVSHR